MAQILVMLVVSAVLFAFLMVWQVKHVPNDPFAILKYNLIIAPIIYIANSALGMAFIKGHEFIANLPLINAVQTFIYYLLLLFFSVWILGDEIDIGRATLAFLLIAIAVWLLKK